MNERRLLAGLLVLGASSGCIRASHLSSECALAPTAGAWTAIDVPGRIEGTVSDLQESAPLSNLGLRLDGTTRAVRTDAAGGFRFDSLPDGRYVVVTEGSVYQMRRDTLTLPAGAGLRGDIRLSTRRDVLRSCNLHRP